MPLLSFEGVEVDIPTSLAGIQFAFRNGALSIQCTNFTGEVVLSKPAAPAGASAPPSVSRADAPVKKRSLDPSSFVGDDDDADDSESSASELLSKRSRPNFLNAVEQSMLLAQLQSASSPAGVSLPADASEKEKDAARALSSTKTKTPVVSSTVATLASSKTPATTALSVKKASNTVQTTLFSPDASKQLTTRKATPESQKKRSRAPKASASSSDGAFSTSAKSTKARAQLAVRAVAKPPVTGQWHEVQALGSLPVERWGDSATKIAHDRVVVYGGADDDETTLGSVHVFDLKTREWSKPLNCESIPRTWHDAVYLEAKHLLLVFGGERFMGDEQVDVLADIMVLDTECFLWYPPAVSGVAPAARSGHTCTVVGDDVVVFGGSRGRSRQSTVHVLDSNTWHWKPVKVDGKPPAARTYHSAVAVGDRIVFFGGNDAKMSFDSVHVLLKKGADAWTWYHPCVVGAPPRARTGHSATLVDGSQILVFGGWDPQREGAGDVISVFDDAFLLDTETWEWDPVAITKTIARVGDDGGEPQVLALPGRVGHRAVLDAHNNVLIFGGQDANDKRLNTIHSISLRLAERGVMKDEQPEPEGSVAAQLKPE